MALTREDVLYRLNLVRRSLMLASSLSRPHEALEVLEKFVYASNQLGALTAADLARGRLNDLSGDIISVLRQRKTLMKQLQEKVSPGGKKPSYPMLLSVGPGKS